MKKIISISIACLAAIASVKAQTPADSVKQTINNLFSAMLNSDAKLLQSVFADSAILQTISSDKASGHTEVRNQMISHFVSQIASLPRNAADERITFSSVQVDGDLASVWTPYKFYYNGNFSHCGVNSFQLVRLNSGWKIQYLVDTRRKQGCTD